MITVFFAHQTPSMFHCRWREEAETDSVRFQDKLTHLEQEKTDAVIAMKKKLDAMEIGKTNEIGRLQDLH